MTSYACVEGWRQNTDRAEAYALKLEAALKLLKRGDCWCEVGIGNPMVTQHSAGCLAAQALISPEKRPSEGV